MDIKENNQQKPPPDKENKPASETVHKFWIGGFLLVAIGCLLISFLMRFHVFDFTGKYRALIVKLLLAAGISMLVLAFARLCEMLVLKRTHVKSLKYNLVRLI